MSELPPGSAIDDQAVRDAQALAEERRRDMLPHLYGYPWYEWAYEFFESRNKTNLLCAANQISKSSTQIRKCIHWATEKSLWPELWPGKTPNQFWYLYPSQKVLAAEFETKWSEFLPKGAMRNDPRYGWKELKTKEGISGVRFNSGVIVYFKLYSQKVSDLQAGSVYAMFCDEEMPLHLYDELMFRMTATNGYFHMVFTATLGQDFWRRALEAGAKEKEELQGAWKRQVSLYDSQKYIDGSPSQWTDERISQVKAKCKTHQEIERRVYGKFILATGRRYPNFDATRHTKKAHPIPEDWHVYVGEDTGSGGEGGHPAALCYVAVRPDYKQGRVFAGWRGDGIVTDSAAIVRKHIEIKEKKKLKPIAQFYDYASKEFFIVASGMGETFLPAEKGKELGDKIINTLFGNDMMLIYENEETVKLAQELSTLKADDNYRHAKNNFSDAFRYAVTRIPWDFAGCAESVEFTVKKTEEKLSPFQEQVKQRREMMNEPEESPWSSPDEEIEEWNELAGC